MARSAASQDQPALHTGGPSARDLALAVSSACHDGTLLQVSAAAYRLEDQADLVQGCIMALGLDSQGQVSG